MKRFLAIALCLLMCASLLTGCSDTGLRIDGKNIDLGIYAYFFGSNYQSYYLEGNDVVSQVAMESLKQYLAVKEIAKEQKVELEPLERKAVIDTVNAQAAQLGSSAWKSVLDTLGLSESQFLDIQYSYTLVTKLREHFFNKETGLTPLSVEEVAAAYRGQFVHCQHILISTQTAQSEADYGKALKAANEAYARAVAGEDFVALMHEYSEDPGQPDDGYYFTEGQMVTQFENAAFALEEGEISEPVQSSYGYHIIRRLPIGDEQANAAYDTYYDYYAQRAFNDILFEYTSPMVIETSDKFLNYDLSGAVSVFGG